MDTVKYNWETEFITADSLMVHTFSDRVQVVTNIHTGEHRVLQALARGGEGVPRRVEVGEVPTGTFLLPHLREKEGKRTGNKTRHGRKALGLKTEIMREIKFRGKISSENLEELTGFNIPHENGWIEGNLVAPNLIVGDLAEVDEDYFNTEWWCTVDPETIGQFTGMKDKNGKEIYEGDIVRFCDDPPYCSDYMIKYDDVGMLWVADGVNDFIEDLWELGEDCVEVIGNIYDNAELLND